jgi:catechol 2,3-dioxygenase-like lactoylglutathione lyase family enzyme
MHALASFTLGGLAGVILMTDLPQDKQAKHDDPVQLGNFSVSLNVKDIKASKAFYEKLDFKQVSGKLEQNWVVLQSGTTKIGLFQGMFERNSLTFNPGWDNEKKTLKDFQDVRELQRTLKARGLALQTECDETTDGPAFFSLADPDGNPILVDQHVPKPKR